MFNDEQQYDKQFLLLLIHRLTRNIFWVITEWAVLYFILYIIGINVFSTTDLQLIKTICFILSILIVITWEWLDLYFLINKNQKYTLKKETKTSTSNTTPSKSTKIIK